MQLHHGLSACLDAQRVHVPGAAVAGGQGRTVPVKTVQRPRARTLLVPLPDRTHPAVPLCEKDIFILICTGKKINPFWRPKQIFRNSPETGRVCRDFFVKNIPFATPPRRSIFQSNSFRQMFAGSGDSDPLCGEPFLCPQNQPLRTVCISLLESCGQGILLLHFLLD